MARTLSGLPRHESSPGRAGSAAAPASALATSRAARTPKTAPRASTTTYSDAGAARRRAISASPASDGSINASADTACDTEPIVTHGRRAAGVAVTRASLATASGRPSSSTMTMPRAPAAWARRTASASGRSARTSIALRASACAEMSGSRSRTACCRNTDVELTHIKAATSIAQNAVGCAFVAPTRQQGQREHADAQRDDPARPAGAERAVAHVAADPPDQRTQELPAVERQARQQVVQADDRVAPGETGGKQNGRRHRSGNQPCTTAAPACDDEVRQRPDDGDRRRLPRLSGSRASAEWPEKKLSEMRCTGIEKLRATTQCAASCTRIDKPKEDAEGGGHGIPASADAGTARPTAGRIAR